MTKEEKHAKIIDFLKKHSSAPNQETINKRNARREYREALEKAIKDYNYNEKEAEAFKMGIIWKELWDLRLKE